MGGVLTSLVTEIAFTPGVWTNVTNDVDLNAGMRLERPAFRLGETAGSVTLDIQLRNIPDAFGITKYTPDNPMGPYYPNVVRDKLIRVTATKGATSWERFRGFIDRWEPDSSDGEIIGQRVAVTASGVLARYSRKTMLSHYSESLLSYAKANGRAIDLWPLRDGEAPTGVRNVGFNSSGDTDGVNGSRVYQGLVIPATNGDFNGQANFGDPDGGILLEGSVGFTRSDAGNAASPVLKLRLQNDPVSRISLWAKVDQEPVNYDDMITGYNSRGACLWRFGPIESPTVTGRTDMAFTDATGSVLTTFNVSDANDGAWRWYSLLFYYSGGEPAVAFAIRTKNVADSIVSNSFMGLGPDGNRYDGADTRYIVVGGLMLPRREGSQSNTFMGSVAGIYAMHGAYGDTSFSSKASPTVVTYGDALTADYDDFGSQIDTLVGGTADSGGGDFTSVCYTLSGTGQTLLDAWSMAATTSGGILAERPNGRRFYRKGGDCRSPTMTFTVDAQGDCQGGPSWEHVERPTRVTANSPNGSVTVIDTTTELATGLQSDSTIDTSAATTDYAAQVASYLTHQGEGLRLAQFAVDLTTSEADLWNDLMSMLHGDRAKLAGMPVGLYGSTEVVFYVDSWTEEYTPTSTIFTIRTIAADDPPKAVTDNAEYGRVAAGDPSTATITGGTCIGTTSTGTVVITASDGPWSTDSGDYPMDLNWSGERITVTAPGGATSPQTFTVTARGVSPSGVRSSHSSGEAVEIWHAAAVAF